MLGIESSKSWVTSEPPLEYHVFLWGCGLVSVEKWYMHSQIEDPLVQNRDELLARRLFVAGTWLTC